MNPEYEPLTCDQLRALKKRVGKAKHEGIDEAIAEKALAMLDEIEINHDAPIEGVTVDINRPSISMILPMPPNETNPGSGKGHWRTRHKERQAYFDTLDMLRATRMIPKPPANPWKRVRMTATLYVWNIMDEDGAMARLKRPVDWLVRNGYLENDRRENIQWAGLPDQHIDRKAQRIELTVEPMTQERAA